MVRNPTAALVAVLLLASPGFASAQSNRTQRVFRGSRVNRVFAPPGFNGVPYPRDNERYCYLPSSRCENQHRVTN
jgi:hypothetical protein